MGYKFKVSVYADKGLADKNLENFYADRQYMRYQEKNAGASYTRTTHGGKHMYAVLSETMPAGKGTAFAAFFLDKLFKKKIKGTGHRVTAYLRNAVLGIHDAMRQSLEPGDGSTAAILYIRKNDVYTARLGKGKLYKYFPSTGRIEEAEGDSNSGAYLGMHGNVMPETLYWGKLNGRKSFLLLGAGIYKSLNHDAICAVLKQNEKNTAEALANKAREAGATENLTAVYIQPKKKYGWIIGLVCLAALLGFCLHSCSKCGKTVQTMAPVTETAVLPEQPSADEPPADELAALAPKLDAVAAEITGADSKTAYYIKNLNTGEALVKNNGKMFSASVIKLFIMTEVYNRAAQGQLTLDDHVRGLLKDMITASSNESANELATLCGDGDFKTGASRITQTAAALGCTDTVQYNDLQAVRTVDIPRSQWNVTSVRDCGLLLEKIYNKTLVSANASAEMLQYLKGQQRRNKIPKYLNGVTVANKTGETSTAQNDVGIVFTEKGDYILCIMINDYGNAPDTAAEVVARMSETVYDYFMSDAVRGIS